MKNVRISVINNKGEVNIKNLSRYYNCFLIFFPFRIFNFEEKILIKILKTCIDNKIYPCEISLNSS